MSGPGLTLDDGYVVASVPVLGHQEGEEETYASYGQQYESDHVEVDAFCVEADCPIQDRSECDQEEAPAYAAGSHGAPFRCQLWLYPVPPGVKRMEGAQSGRSWRYLCASGAEGDVASVLHALPRDRFGRLVDSIAGGSY